jgi:hypothetical protein
MPVTQNLYLSSAQDMLKAMREMQTYLGQPVAASIVDQDMPLAIIKLQKYLSTQADSSTPSGFRFDPARVKTGYANFNIAAAIMHLQQSINDTDAPTNYMSYSEDPVRFNYLTGGTGLAIPHVFSAGASVAVGTKQAVPDIPGGEATKGFTCTGLCKDPDSSDIWVGNFGNSRGGAGGSQTPISAVRLSSNGATLISQVTLTQASGGLQGLAFITGPLKCLAYVDGSSSRICFVNTNGTIPRDPLVLPFVPNALTWDDGRQALVVGDAASGDVWWMTIDGTLLFAADFTGWGGPVDHVCIDTSRGTNGYLWASTGANGSPGTLIAWDIAKDMLVQRFALADAQAPEGIIVNGSNLTIAVDGYYHSTGSPPNTVGPYNVNEIQTYTIPAVTQFRYARVWKAGELTGPYGRRPYHMLMDRGDGDTSADYCIVTRDADASINGQPAIMAWSGKSFDGTTQNAGFRLLNGASLANNAFTGAYSRPTALAAAFSNASNNTQIGTRGTQTPDRTFNLIGTALAVQLGSTPVAYKPRLGA